MLKRILAGTAVAVMFALPLQAQGQPQAGDAKEVTITGQVVDLNCYTLMGAKGEGHKECAGKCASAGVPLGILGDDGTLYLPLGSGMGNAQNPKFAPYAEQKVKVTGVHRTKNGLHTIEVKSVSAAS
ncbi:MAG TPA: hypothetical protein VNI61_02650 [Gemmatimonadales bacterium]|nr:hypothetical protein [Gemmatimonadales bacterium]